MQTPRIPVAAATAAALFSLLLASGSAHAQDEGAEEGAQEEGVQEEGAEEDVQEEDVQEEGAEDPDESGEEAGPSAEDLEKAKKSFVKGKELFEAEDFEGAVKDFKQSYRLSRNPLLLYNIGYTLDELGDEKLALFYYRKFLEDAPEEADNREFVSGRVEELGRKEEADDVFESGMGATSKGSEGTSGGEEFQHKIIEEVPPGTPVDVTAFVPEGSDWQVTLFYRASGQSEFTSVEMQPRYNELVGRIPAAITTSASTVQYYIEVRDTGGDVVERSGKSTSPHLVFIEEGAKPRYYPDLNDEQGVAGTGSGAGLGAGPTGSGKWTDIRSTKYQYTKWGVTGGAVGLLALSATFYFIAADASSSLEAEAVSSGMDGCRPTEPPCLTFSDKQKDLQSRGKTFETLANVSLGVGVAAALGAGALWYWEFRQNDKTDSEDDARLGAAPVFGRDFVGAAAAMRF